MNVEGAVALVTGGAGFIGSHLVDRLLELDAQRVIVVDNFFLGKERNIAAAQSAGNRFELYRQDAANPDGMAEIIAAHRPDVVFNLATKALLHSFEDPVDAYWVNVRLAATLGEILRSGGYPKLVHVSSSEVYGTAENVPMKESHQLGAQTTYAAGKASADLLLKSYVSMFDVDIPIVRPFNTYGPRQNEYALAAVIPATIRRVAEGRPPLIEGTGGQTRDFLYVDDTVSAIVALGCRDDLRGKVVNVGSGSETSIETVIDEVCHAMGYDGPVERAPKRVADVDRHFADVALASELIGPSRRTDLSTGIGKTVEWFQEELARAPAG